MLYLRFPFLPVNFPHELFQITRASPSRVVAQNRARDVERIAFVAADGAGTAAYFQFPAQKTRAFVAGAGPTSSGAAAGDL